MELESIDLLYTRVQAVDGTEQVSSVCSPSQIVSSSLDLSASDANSPVISASGSIGQ